LLQRDERALRSFERAESAAVKAEMQLHAAVARRARGVLMGGDTGRELAAAAESEIRREGVVSPARLAAMMSPGLKSR
jgi:hypothetical protein